MDPHSIACVVLAGGAGRRLGGADKALLPLAGQPVIAHVIHAMRPQCAALAINANGPAERFADLALPVLPDPVEGSAGPLVGILAAMRWARQVGRDRVATVPCDTPFLPSDLIARLVAEDWGGPVLAAVEGPEEPALHPVIGLWPVALAEDLGAAQAAGERKVRVWAGRHDPALAVFPEAAAGAFVNLNTPADWQAAEARIKGQGRPPEG